MVAGHIASEIRKERINSKWDQAIKPQSPPTVNNFLYKAPPPKGSATFPNSATSNGPSIQTHNPMGAFHIQTTTNSISVEIANWIDVIRMILLTIFVG